MIIPDGTAQANLLFTGSGVPTGAQITLGLSVDTFVGTPTDAAAVVIDAWDDSNIENQLVNQVALTGVLVKFGPNATGPAAQVSANIPGASTQDGVTPNVSVLVQKNTGLGGRSGRGRFYIPGLPESTVLSSGIIGPSTVAAIQDAMTLFHSALVTGDLPPLLLHADLSAPIDTPLPITSLTVSNRVATQRRRNRR